MIQKHMDYILLWVPQGSECLAKYILGFSQYRIEKILLPEALFQAQLVLGFSLGNMLPFFHWKCKWAQSISFFRMLSGNACLICRRHLHRWHHLWGEGGEREERERESVFNYPDDQMIHKIQLLGSLFVLKHYLCPVQMSLNLSRGSSQWCSNSWVSEGIRLSPVWVTGKGEATLEASQVLHRRDVITFAKRDAGSLFPLYCKGSDGVGTRFQLINLWFK